MPGILISAETLRIEGAGFIARIPKEDIEQHMNRKELLQKIVEDYKNERATTVRESAHHIS